MQIRNIQRKDIESLKIIHDKYFRHEFDFPDFLNNYLCNFVIINEFDEIVTAGGIRPIAEVVLLTDLNTPVTDRYVALHKALEISNYAAHKSGFDAIHAFVQSESWRDRLIKTGFQPTKGEALVRGID